MGDLSCNSNDRPGRVSSDVSSAHMTVSRNACEGQVALQRACRPARLSGCPHTHSLWTGLLHRWGHSPLADPVRPVVRHPLTSPASDRKSNVAIYLRKRAHFGAEMKMVELRGRLSVPVYRAVIKARWESCWTPTKPLTSHDAASWSEKGHALRDEMSRLTDQRRRLIAPTRRPSRRAGRQKTQ